MGSIRRLIWKVIWVCSFCTLQITIIYKDGVVIKLESIWGEGEVEVEVKPDEVALKDRVKLGVSPSTKVEYWDVR
jgi:hypothetical protein|tara:strand:+ start:312 stop:536 length:225 start_codon:yes stop_codon:yes gene_type:complete